MAQASLSAVFAVLLCLGGNVQGAETKHGPPPPAPAPGCTDCGEAFGLQWKPPPADYSYDPVSSSKPFGEWNCGQREVATRPIERALRDYAPFVNFTAGTTLREVVFEGAGEKAIDCMILLARVQQRRLAESRRIGNRPLLFKWKHLLVKYDPRADTKIIWIPVAPSEEEKRDATFLDRTARKMFGSLGTPREDLYANRVQLTVGFGTSWVTISLKKNEKGSLVEVVHEGMGTTRLPA